MLSTELYLKVGGRQWKVMERIEVWLWRMLELQEIWGELMQEGLQEIIVELLQEELQGNGGKVQVDLPWHLALTQESGEEEMQISEALADRIPTW